MEGTFGRVYRGSYTEEDGIEEEVLVKTVTGKSLNSLLSERLSSQIEVLSLNVHIPHLYGCGVHYLRIWKSTTLILLMKYINLFLDQASAIQISLLLQEGMAMYGLSHKNILSILGVSIEDHTAPFLIYPHQGYTNLKR